ncbi:MAG: prolipoprotein diacylglyceryl transferase [Eubacteriales bacterium]
MNDTNLIGFPNLGLGPWEINKYLIHTDHFRIAWYGIIITIGIIVAVALICRNAKKEGYTTDDVLDYAIWVVLFGILGARLYYVAMTWGRYESFLDVFAIWNGGLAIYGGIIGGALTILVISYLKGKNTLKFFDMVAPGVMLAQAIGRWGNFFNAEAYGSILKYEFLGKTFETSRFAGMAIPWIMTIQTDAEAIATYAHPTFLYESLWNILGFILIMLRYRNKKFDGQILFSYIVWYGFGRMFIEGFRTDSLYLGNVRISQLLAIGCVIFGVMFYHLLRKKAKPVLAAVQDAEEYENLFSEKKQTAKKKKSAMREYAHDPAADKKETELPKSDVTDGGAKDNTDNSDAEETDKGTDPETDDK